MAITRAVEKLCLIHPADYTFRDAWIKGCSIVEMLNAQSAASRFLVEANISLSVKVGRAIEGVGRLDCFSAKDVAIANSYLKKVGADCGLLERIETDSEESFAQRCRKRLTIHEARVGLKVIHAQFGEGEIVAIADKKQGRIKVNFSDHGQMVLLLAYAKIYVES